MAAATYDNVKLYIGDVEVTDATCVSIDYAPRKDRAAAPPPKPAREANASRLAAIQAELGHRHVVRFERDARGYANDRGSTYTPLADAAFAACEWLTGLGIGSNVCALSLYIGGKLTMPESEAILRAVTERAPAHVDVRIAHMHLATDSDIAARAKPPPDAEVRVGDVREVNDFSTLTVISVDGADCRWRFVTGPAAVAGQTFANALETIGSLRLIRRAEVPKNVVAMTGPELEAALAAGAAAAQFLALHDAFAALWDAMQTPEGKRQLDRLMVDDYVARCPSSLNREAFRAACVFCVEELATMPGHMADEGDVFDVLLDKLLGENNCVGTICGDFVVDEAVAYYWRAVGKREQVAGPWLGRRSARGGWR